MFKQIQNQLLLRHPLLWNLKIVPVIAVTIALHIIFFSLGYFHGTVDFTKTGDEYYFDALPALVIFFSVFISLLVLIIWLVFYFRNNAFKSYYPKNKLSLYKEFLLLFILCTINCSYVFSFMYASEMHQRSYFSEQEFSRRIDIISMASLFVDGGFEEGEYIYEEKDGESIRTRRETFMYDGREYSLNSLMNKSVTDFSYQGMVKDSLNERRVKKWLIENRKDSVLWVMREFDKIAKEHNVKSNIAPPEWLKLVYDYPAFTNYITIGRIDSYPEGNNPVDYADNYDYDYTQVVAETEPTDPYRNYQSLDTISNNIKIINGHTYIYPKYYEPFRQLENSYGIISGAWSGPDANGGLALFFAYFGLGLSLLIFSFRVTSGRNWLIALVAFGVTALITGIINVVYSIIIPYNSMLGGFRDTLYITVWLVIAVVLLIWFFAKRKSKGISGIILNIVLWITPSILPVIGFLILDYVEDQAVYEYGERITPVTGYEAWMKDNPELFMLFCGIVFLAFMYFFTISIKRWKGIAES
ncbi:hypothetical protein HYN59_12920 [Flavobacterium album]|uniref:Uncharacterized protein n=1 Tax=Flavobacterium album TaxID=2175091 RepID=A0A2S1QZU5_9FLAO|nr:hypothetical protein [Flavobacterium album]AWH85953.1 hypothetical protein HYN59_12920 [Flavobacterium album]